MKLLLPIHTKLPVIIAQKIFSYGPKVMRADEILLKHAGWKPGAARGISHGIFSGTAAANLIKSDNGIEPDGQISYKNGTTSNKQNQARSGRKSNYRFRRNRRFHSCSCKRRPRSNRYSRS